MSFTPLCDGRRWYVSNIHSSECPIFIQLQTYVASLVSLGFPLPFVFLYLHFSFSLCPRSIKYPALTRPFVFCLCSPPLVSRKEEDSLTAINNCRQRSPETALTRKKELLQCLSGNLVLSEGKGKLPEFLVSLQQTRNRKE